MTSAARPLTRQRPLSERIIEPLLFLAAARSASVTTVGIILVLAFQTLEFFLEVSPIDFFTGTGGPRRSKPYALGRPRRWSPARSSWPVIAMLIAIPLGLLAAILLSEYASPAVRNVVKPLLETIAGIPTIVLGFFGLNFLAPQLLTADHRRGQHRALLGAVRRDRGRDPDHAADRLDLGGRDASGPAGTARRRLRDGRDEVRGRPQGRPPGGALGDHGLDHPRHEPRDRRDDDRGRSRSATKPQFTFDPLESVQTMTAFIVQITIGETAQGSIQFKSLFAVGATLFVITLALNLMSAWVVRRFRTVY